MTLLSIILGLTLPTISKSTGVILFIVAVCIRKITKLIKTLLIIAAIALFVIPFAMQYVPMLIQ
jgi:hypothetical protein